MSNQKVSSVLMTDPILIRMCLDDGSTFVTSEGEIKTANPQAPKLDDIVHDRQRRCDQPNLCG